MKRKIINISLDIMTLIVEIYLFCLGRSMLYKSGSINYKLNTFKDITDILFNGKLYTAENLRLWFIAIFVLYIFIFIKLYRSLTKESLNYRSLKLYRYGKVKYINHCKNKTLIANIQSVIILFIGVILIRLLLLFQGVNISFELSQFVSIVIPLFKIFITMELLGSLNIYFLFQYNNTFVMIYSVTILFMSVIIDTYIDLINIYSYENILQKVLFLGLYEFINILIYYWCMNSTKKKSMC